ncbi:MAG TPA: DUF1801 domain-containing protein [Novosphingobium sp.]|nr:DUF1801 domain-containing protein [Novosphingobium sp.]
MDRTVERLPRACAEQRVKWGNLLFAHGGQCILIHVEDHRVLLGFFRGKRLASFDPAIKPSGKYELGNIGFGPDDVIDAARISQLAARAAALNAKLGDPARRS